VRRGGAAWLVVLGVVASAAAMDALPLAFPDVVARADRIVHGTVVDVASGRDADGIPATWVTLDVSESLKGEAERRFTFKQLGVATPLADGTMLRLPGLPRPRPGDEVVLFLHRPSGRGFTSPVGLGQGFYRVEANAGSRRVARSVGPDAPEPLAKFLDRVRAAVAR
jgi:hypothetical protein